MIIIAIIEGFRVQNYRSLKDVTLGRLWNQQNKRPLTPLVAVIGKNGVGKSTLFDAFGFLADALRVGVEEACDLKQRGGFNRLRSFGSKEPIRFEIYYCFKGPENGLYHKLLDSLAMEFRAHATGKKNSAQIFVTTHQPYFADALLPEETWILEKDADGFSTVRRASEDPIVKNMVAEGLPLGGLWYSDYLD